MCWLCMIFLSAKLVLKAWRDREREREREREGGRGVEKGGERSR